MNPSLEIFTLPFVRLALIAGVLIGGICSYLGVFVVLRRVVFVGIALAQLAALGVAVATWLHVLPEVVALAVALAGALFLGTPLARRLLPRETDVGFVYAAASALAILVVAKSAQGEAEMLGILFGNILTETEAEVILLAVVAVVVAIVHALFYRPFLFTSFDPETARAAGFRVGGWTALFDLTLAGAIAAALHAAGALLVFSYLVQPAMVGLLLGRRMRTVFLISVGAGLLATIGGLFLSIVADLPTGPTVVACSSLLVVVAYAWSRARRRLEG